MKRSLLVLLILLCHVAAARGQAEQEIPGTFGHLPDACMDDQGNVHLVWIHDDCDWVCYARFDWAAQQWSTPLVLPQSDDIWPTFGRPKVEVGPDCKPQVVWGVWGLAYFKHAKALDSQGTQWTVTALGNDWRAFVDLAVDQQNRAHFVFGRVTQNPTAWRSIYLDPDGNETEFAVGYSDATKPLYPQIKVSAGGTVHVSLMKGFPGGSDVYYGNSDEGFALHQMTHNPWGWYVSFPRLALSPATGKAAMVFFNYDITGDPAYLRGVYYTEQDWNQEIQLWGCTALTQEYIWYPQIDYSASATRYVAWTVYDFGETYYKIADDPAVWMTSAGEPTVAAGVNGAMVVRGKGNPLGSLWWFTLTEGPVYYPPTAQIDDISPNPAYQQQDVVQFTGSAWDNDEGGQSITAYEWSSDKDGFLSDAEDFQRSADNLSVGQHVITFKVWDDENQTDQTTAPLTIAQLYPPSAMIDSITPNPATQQLDVVHFEGSAWDNDEGGQSIVSYQWSSSLDGTLSYGEDFDRPAADLTAGAHLITLEVLDDDNQTAQDTMTLVVNPPPLPPTAVIDSIVPNPAIQEQDTVGFYGSAWDNDENGQCIVSYRWTSNLGGILSNQEDVSLPASSLAAGAHLITFKVWDDEGQTAQDTMTLVIEPSPFQPPTAVIDSIVPDSSYYGIDTVYFYGSAWDNDEQGQAIEVYEWSSDMDGTLGSTEDFWLPADSLSPGSHLITFRVWDDEQQTNDDTMTIVVLNPGSVPPSAVIDSITPSPAMQQRDTLSFCGSAWDNDPTDIIEAYEWWSPRLGQVLSRQEDFMLPADSLPLGLNAVRFTAWDDEGDSAVAWGSASIVDYTPVPLAPQALVCEYEEGDNRVKLVWIGPFAATFNVYHDTLAYFVGADPVASDLTGPPWYHDDPDLTDHHFYYVTSENMGGESEPSEHVGLVPYDTGP
jgi:hypothetical protein